jgi:hypothetical protein
VRELQHLARHRAIDAGQRGYAVAHRDDGANFRNVDLRREASELFAKNAGNIVCLDLHLRSSGRSLTYSGL